MESKGSAKANFLFFIKSDQPKIAIAYCGAKPSGLLGTILYNADTRINKTSATITDRVIFIIEKILENKNRL